MKSPATRLLVQEHADRSFLQRLHTWTRHAINGPQPTRNVLGDDSPDLTTTTPVAVVTPAIVPTLVPTIVKRVKNKVPGWAIAGLSAAIAGPIAAGAVALGHYMSTSNSEHANPTPTIIQPIQPITEPTPQPLPEPAGSATHDGDLLEWLHEKGYDRP